MYHGSRSWSRLRRIVQLPITHAWSCNILWRRQKTIWFWNSSYVLYERGKFFRNFLLLFGWHSYDWLRTPYAIALILWVRCVARVFRWIFFYFSAFVFYFKTVSTEKYTGVENGKCWDTEWCVLPYFFFRLYFHITRNRGWTKLNSVLRQMFLATHFAKIEVEGYFNM